MTKQAFYKTPSVIRVPSQGTVAKVTEFCRAERSFDPMIGCRKLWKLYKKEQGYISRRTFESILAANELILRLSRRTTRTTFSGHGLRLYPNLVYSLIPERPCQVWVADITYIRLHNTDGTTRFCYLSIVMDAYSRYIMGYYVGLTLETAYSLVALNLALENSHKLGLDITGMIHHSDRGVQYASEDHVEVLKTNSISISMTEDSNPTDNSRAERINSTVKNELLHGCEFKDIQDVMDKLPNRIAYYNNRRPHMSLGGITPAEALRKRGELKKEWKSYRDEAIAREKKTV